MSNLMQVIQSRRSTRVSGRAPPKGTDHAACRGRRVGALRRRQIPVAFTVVYSAEKSYKLARAVAEVDNRGPEYNFTALRSTSSSPYQRGEHHAFVDGAAAMENLLLMATELGLGSCWINQLRETCDIPSVRALLTEYGVPKDHIVICSAAVGYIAKKPPPSPRQGTVTFTE